MSIVGIIKPYIPVSVKRKIKGWLMEAKRLTNKEFREYLETGWYRVSYGDKHPDETVMVLQRVETLCGPYSDWISFLSYCKYAEEKQFIVVIDRKTYPPPYYQNQDLLGYENAWSYFFDQPCGLSFEDIQNGGYANVLLCRLDRLYVEMSRGYNTFWPLAYSNLYPISEEHDQLYHLIAEKYFPLNRETRDKTEEAYLRLLKGRRVLGVAARIGYSVGFSHGWGDAHPFQPTIELLADDIAKYMKEWACDFIFLTCDTIECRDYFIERFGEKLLYVERELPSYRHMPEEEIILAHIDGKEAPRIDMVEFNRPYIIEMQLLSKCTSLLCGNTSGTVAARIMNGGQYEHVYVYDLGYNHV